MNEDDPLAPARALDDAVSRVPAVIRGWGAIVTLSLTIFSLGFAAGSWGVRKDISELRDVDREAAALRTAMQADISTNRSNIARVESVLQTADVVNMAERVRRIDRELCLMRYDAAGTVTPAMQQECASR